MPLTRKKPLKRTPIRRNSPLKRSIKALKRVPLWGKPRKKTGLENEEYRNWLRTWPCFVCFKKHIELLCEQFGTFEEEAARPVVRRMCREVCQPKECGPTQAAHVGPHGMGQRCPDSESMPLGQKHHLHLTAGGGPESHHTLGTKFWEFHNLNRDEVFELLHRLYREETGREL